MPRQYSCSFCSKTFSRAFNLRKHVANMHGQRPTTSSSTAALTSSSGRQEDDPRPRYDEIVDESPIFEHGCEVPECERCFRYFNSLEELRKHEEVKILICQNFTASESSLYTMDNFVLGLLMLNHDLILFEIFYP